MTIPLAYVLHSGQMFGTERMALATLAALRGSFSGLIIAPPGPVHAAARERGLQSCATQGRLRMVWAMLKHLRQHPDSALFATGVWQSMVAGAARGLLGWKGAHVHVVHGGTDERLSYGRKRLLAALSLRFVAVSGFVRERLLAHGVPAARIDVIHNFLPQAPAAERPRFTHDGVRRVVMLSRLDRIKRVGLLFDALERVPGLDRIEFDVYGSGEEAALLRERARAFPNVHLHGFVPDASEALAQADLLLHTCPEEPFGLVLLEAFAAGVPVLVPGSGGAADIVHDGVNGWHLAANDAIALGRQLSRAMYAPAVTLNALADGGRLSLQRDFSASRQAGRYGALARSLA